MKRILLIATIYRVGERIYPIIPKLSKEFNQLFTDSLARLVEAGGKSDYFEAGMHPLLNKTDVYYSDVSDLPCLEIDFLEDLVEARSLF